MTRAEEQRLISLAAAGDRPCAEALIRAHQASLYAYLLRLSGRADVAEDVVQEAFVRVLGNLDRFDPRFRFSTWLFTIAKRLYVNINQRMRPAYDTDTVGACAGAWTSPDSPTVGAEVGENAHQAVQRALLELPLDQREVVVLFHQFDWPIAQIARHLEIPEGTVKSHLHRGRNRMREFLQRHETLTRHVGEVWS